MPLRWVILIPGTSFAELRTSFVLPGFGSVDVIEKLLRKLPVWGMFLGFAYQSYDGLVDKPS